MQLFQSPVSLMIIDLDTVGKIGDAVVLTYPVLAVAYFIDDRSSTEVQRRVAIPAAWATGWRNQLVRLVHPWTDRNGLVLPADLKYRNNRAMLAYVVIGLLCGFAGRVAADYSRPARVFTAASLVLLIYSLGRIFVYSTQRLVWQRVDRLSSESENMPVEADLGDLPFSTLAWMSVLMLVFTVGSIVLGILIVTSSAT